MRLDLRGHGGSDVSGGPWTAARLGQDVVSLLDGLGVPAAHVAGVSIGGLLALWLAVHAPARVRRLVLANTAACIGERSAWDARIDAVRQGGLAPLAEASMGRWFTPAFRAARPDVEGRFRAGLAAVSPDGYAGCCAVLRDTDLRPDAPRVSARTLVVAGLHDVATPPAAGEWLAQQIPGATLCVLDAAHLANVDRPDAFLAAVRPFLGS